MMGLDTTHGCWSGPYSAFMWWREHLNFLIMTERGKTDDRCRDVGHLGATREALLRAWDEGLYDDQTVPLNVLMLHSDCDGEIATDICGPLADALEGLMERRMPPRALYDTMRPATERFIGGLRKAAKAGEAVGFH